MRRVIEHFDVEHGGEAAESLRADAELVDAPIDLEAQLLELDCGSAREQLGDVDRIHQRLLGEQHGLLGAAADADAEHARADTNPRPSPGTTSSTQSATESDGFSMANMDLFSDPPPLAATVISTVSPGTNSVWITAGVLSRVLVRLQGRIGHDGGAQLVVGIEIGAPHALVDHAPRDRAPHPSARPCPP